MRAWRLFSLVGLVVLAAPACGSNDTTAPVPASPAPLHARAPEARDAKATPACTEIDVPALLRQHGVAFGTADALVAELPRTLAGEVTHEGKHGGFELVLDRTRHRNASSIGAFYLADGQDERGTWSLGPAGVIERISPAEAVATRFDAWLFRREYLASYVAGRDKAHCEMAADGGRRAHVRFEVPDVGSPRLSFDLESGALLEAQHTMADGTIAVLDVEAWTLKDAHGVRWPSVLVERGPVAGPTEVRITTNAPGLVCAPQLEASGPRSTDCLAPPEPTLIFVWPSRPGAPRRPTPLDPTQAPLQVVDDGVHAAGATKGAAKPSAAANDEVHLPMNFAFGEPLVRATVGDRETWAILDSGAMMSLVDSGTPLAGSFRPTHDAAGAGATSGVRMGIGELASVHLGGLSIQRLPAVAAPVPALDDLAPHRPEILLGYSLFAAAAVRIDYAGEEVVIARDVDRLHGAAATAIPLRVLDGKLFVTATIEGAEGPFTVDTGSDSVLDLYAPWANAHGFPGERPKLMVEGLTGVGTEKTTRVLFRFAGGQLGPLRAENAVATIVNPPGAETAGLIGNAFLGRCRAIVFDVPHRKLWLDGPCDRAVPEIKSGWRLERREDPAIPDRPWVVAATLPGGSAARAGLEVGDRVLEIAGKPASLDASSFRSALSKAAGTRVPVVIERRGERKTVRMELVQLP